MSEYEFTRQRGKRKSVPTKGEQQNSMCKKTVHLGNKEEFSKVSTKDTSEKNDRR